MPGLSIKLSISLVALLTVDHRARVPRNKLSAQGDAWDFPPSFIHNADDHFPGFPPLRIRGFVMEGGGGRVLGQRQIIPATT